MLFVDRYNMRALPSEVVVEYNNLQPDRDDLFVEPLIKDTVAATVRGAIGHVDSRAVVVGARLTSKRLSTAELVQQYLHSYGEE